MQIETLLNAPTAEVLPLLSSEQDGRCALSLRRLFTKLPAKTHDVKIVSSVLYDGYLIHELETGSIEVSRNGVPVVPAKPTLRELALKLNVSLLSGAGTPRNTRTLGTQIIRSVQALAGHEAPPENV